MNDHGTSRGRFEAMQARLSEEYAEHARTRISVSKDYACTLGSVVLAIGLWTRFGTLAVLPLGGGVFFSSRAAINRGRLPKLENDMRTTISQMQREPHASVDGATIVIGDTSAIKD